MYRQRENNHQKPAQAIPRKAVTLKQHTDYTFQENLKIYLRLKPQLQFTPTSQCIKILSKKEVQIVPTNFAIQNDKVFSYQEVFEPTATNSQVFKTAMLDPITNVLSGFNSTVFIYGMTGAGKTFTMFNSSQQGQQHQGIVNSTLKKLFTEIQAQKQHQFEVRLSFFEIYNQNIRDLLSQHKEPLILLEDPVQGMIISDLKEIAVDNQKSAQQCIEQGMNRRVREATKHNQSSSRSHALLQLTLRRITPLQQGQYQVRESKLFMIDLAGNQKASQNQSKRFIEGVNINKSLLTLGKCISTLSENKKNAFIPYRDSKLTRILKDSLGGNSKTVMIACVSTDTRFYEETLNTLKYSSKAKQIKNKGNGGLVRKMKMNEVPLLVEEQPVITLEDEEQIFSFVNSIESILTQKIRTQNIQEQLQLCLRDQQLQKSLSPLKLKEVRNTLGKIRQKYKNILLSLQDQIQSFVSVISSLKSLKNSCEKQNKYLREQANRQKEAILKLQSHYNQPNLFFSEKQNQFKSENILNIVPVCLSQTETNSNQQASIHQKFNKNIPKKNSISIKVQSCKNSNKENIPFNNLKRTHTANSSIKSQKNITEHKKITKAYSKPMIEITKQNFKLKSPTMKEPILIRSDSNDNNSICVSLCAEKRSQDFILRLREIDRKASCVDATVISGLLQEYEKEGYQVGRLQKSMISKLRFMMKSRSKSERKQPHCVRNVQL